MRSSSPDPYPSPRRKQSWTEVESQQGKPFKYEAKLAQAKVMCAELDGKLKASIEPAKQAQPDTPETADALDPALARHRRAPAPTKAGPAAAARKQTATGAPRDLNLQVSEEVFETIDFTKFKTKLTKRAIVEQAVLAHWAQYRPK